MKKLLSLFGALGIAASGSSYVVSCGNNDAVGEENDGIGGSEVVTKENIDEMVDLYLRVEKKEIPDLELAALKEQTEHFGKDWRPDTDEKKNELYKFKRSQDNLQKAVILKINNNVLEFKICSFENGVDKIMEKNPELGEVGKEKLITTKEKLVEILKYIINAYNEGKSISEKNLEYINKVIKKYS
ncbi:hypothetical protein SLITO_v1c08510 [Spiroplasma litorale]|uniref:Lipoprotein n=1 Tax=Spiroplasma litorale TaxID=216942 RepID=A0A0K1W2R3_9MOLU|nr:lipoprotein [Spiroplasma litorale]AKX34466.1 hypothetical protein SLITO_v1c08510 [Spiroplasma litorale]